MSKLKNSFFKSFIKIVLKNTVRNINIIIPLILIFTSGFYLFNSVNQSLVSPNVASAAIRCPIIGGVYQSSWSVVNNRCEVTIPQAVTQRDCVGKGGIFNSTNNRCEASVTFENYNNGTYTVASQTGCRGDLSSNSLNTALLGLGGVTGANRPIIDTSDTLISQDFVNDTVLCQRVSKRPVFNGVIILDNNSCNNYDLTQYASGSVYDSTLCHRPVTNGNDVGLVINDNGEAFDCPVSTIRSGAKLLSIGNESTGWNDDSGDYVCGFDDDTSGFSCDDWCTYNRIERIRGWLPAREVYGCPALFTVTGANCLATALQTDYLLDSVAIGNGTCAPNPVAGNSQVFSCNFPLSGSPNNIYTLPSEVKAFYGKNGNNNDSSNGNLNFSSPCTISGINLVCAGIVADNLTGADFSRNIGLARTGIETYGINMASILITNATCLNGATNFPSCNVCPIGYELISNICVLLLVNSDLPTITSICNGNNTTMVSTQVTCLLEYSANRAFPQNFNSFIGNGDISTSSCTRNALDYKKATCTGVSSGSNIGYQVLFVKLYTSSTATPTQNSVLITRVLSNTDALNLACAPDVVLVGSYETCIGTVASGIIINNLTVKLENETTPTLCTIEPSGLLNALRAISCTNIGVGTSLGLKNIQQKTDEIPVFTNFETVTVVRNSSSTDISLNCTPNIAEVNEVVNCTGSYALNTLFNNPTVHLNNLSVGCTVNQSNRTFTCPPINVGATKGLKDINLTTQTITTQTKMDEVSVFQYITNTSLIPMNCSPDIVLVNQLINCVAVLPQFTKVLNPVIKIDTNGGSVNCSISTLANTDTINCLNLNVGLNTGLKDIFLKTTQIPTFERVEDVLVQSEVKITDIDLDCLPNTVFKGQQLVCTGTVPVNTVATNIVVIIGEGANKIQTNCTKAGANITCLPIIINLPVGEYKVYAKTDQLPNGELVENVKVIVKDEFDPVDFAAIISCTPETALINTTINCAGQFPDFYVTKPVRVYIAEKNVVENCIISNETALTNRQIKCENISVGSNLGLKKIYFLYSNDVADFVVPTGQPTQNPSQPISSWTEFDTVLVVRNATNEDITNQSCSPDNVLINTFTTCTFTILPNTIITNPQVTIDNTNFYPCSLQLNSTTNYTCPQINVGTSTGNKIVKLKADNISTLLDLDTIEVKTNLISGDISLICSPANAFIGDKINCSGSFPAFKFVEKIEVKLDDEVVVCNLRGANQNSFTCPHLTAQGSVGAKFVQLKSNFDSDFVNKFRINVAQKPISSLVRSGQNQLMSITFVSSFSYLIFTLLRLSFKKPVDTE